MPLSIPPELLGPTALTVALLIVVYGAFKEWWVPGSRLRRSDEALQATLGLLKESTESNRTMAQAMEERNKLDVERLRLAQAGLLDEHGEVTRPPRRKTRPNTT